MTTAASIPSPGTPRAPEAVFERIPVVIADDPGEACKQLAREIRSLIEQRQAAGGTAVLGLATGSTPVPLYRELARMHREEGLSFANVVTFNLDEYYGLTRDHPESYHRFMCDQLFDHIDIRPENIHIPDGTVPPEGILQHCQDYEGRIDAAGGIDLQILGIGRTGHIGFNEPGSTRESLTRRITLDRVTRQDAAADFLGVENVPRFAITMGVGSILKARRIVLMAWGENKAGVVAQAVEGPVSEAVSASFLQEHGNAAFLIDRSAASHLTRVRSPWLVGPVAWTPDTAYRAVIWLAEKCSKPVLKLVDEEYNEHGMSDLVTERGGSYPVNIDVFNRLQHTITGWPGGKPGADDTNRPERAEPHPKRVLIFSPEPQDALVAMGGVLERLIEQGHDVRFVAMTSGSLRVRDEDALRFCRALLELSEHSHENSWGGQESEAERLVCLLENKTAFDPDPPEIRRIKALLLRGETRDACAVCGLDRERVVFLYLPFYERGRYRRFLVGADDVEKCVAILRDHQPHQIYATGATADPSSLPAVTHEVLERSFDQVRPEPWAGNCRVWHYRCRETPLQPEEISMAMPMSPDQLERKARLLLGFQTISGMELAVCDENRELAATYDRLGLAEYEAIESLQRRR